MATYKFGRGTGPTEGLELATGVLATFDTDQPIDMAELFRPPDPLVEKVSLELSDTIDAIPLDDALDTPSLARAMAPSVAQLLREAYRRGQKDGLPPSQ